MPPRKKLIEVALPLEAISVASAYEKMPGIGPHPRGIHVWWSRKPLPACRAVLFASLVCDPDSPDAPAAFVSACRELPLNEQSPLDTPRQRLFKFIERLIQWKNASDEKILSDARRLITLACEGNPPIICDPFAGGGSIPLEAQRLGLKAYSSDLNPVSVLINKALIEIPARFANCSPVNPSARNSVTRNEGWKNAFGLADDVRYYSNQILEQAQTLLGNLYPKGPNGETVIAWIWARTVKSPNPAIDVDVPLVSKFELGIKAKRRAWVEPFVEPERKRVEYSVKSGDGKVPLGTVNRRGGRCLITGVPITFDYIRQEGKFGRIGSTLMAIVTDGVNGRNYYSPSFDQEEVARVAVPDNLPDGDLPAHALGFRIQAYGITKYHQMFTSRQLVALKTFSELVQKIGENIRLDALAAGLSNIDIPLQEGGKGAFAYAEAITVFLACILDRVIDFNNALVRWIPSNEKIMSLFGRSAVPMTWEFGEANVLADVVGGWSTCTNYIVDCVGKLVGIIEGVVEQHDARISLNIPAEALICTDPPYYDMMSYSDLTDLFYLWLRQNIRSIYPDIFTTMLTPKTPELVATPFRFDGGQPDADTHFESGLSEAFTNIRNASHPSYPTTIFYAFKQSESEGDEEGNNGTMASSTGWETMLEGLLKAGFTVNGTWPLRTEGTARLRNLNSNALASSIVLVCRPRPDDAQTISRSRFVDLLRKELPAALKEMQSGNIAPVDLAQASIGPGMAIYSRYKAVLEPDGSPLAVRAALGLINQELDTYLAEQDGNIDSDTRFAISWFEQFGFNEGEFGLADVLARAKNASVAGIQEAGVVKAERGKVRLIRWSEYDPDAYDPPSDKRPTIWEATHHLIERLSNHGEEGAALLMNKMKPEVAGEARNLAYRLYSICERKGWADHARDYNTLVIQWPAIAERAAEIRKDVEQNRATQQTSFLDRQDGND